jgi:hypothetical protein
MRRDIVTSQFFSLVLAALPCSSSRPQPRQISLLLPAAMPFWRCVRIHRRNCGLNTVLSAATIACIGSFACNPMSGLLTTLCTPHGKCERREPALF